MKCTPKDMQNIAELWHRAHSLMIERAAPAEVSEVAAEALTSTASLCGFSAPNFIAYEIKTTTMCPFTAMHGIAEGGVWRDRAFWLSTDHVGI